MKKGFYERISSFLPKSLVDKTGELLVQGGFEDFSPRVYVGLAVFFTICMGLLAFFIAPFFFGFLTLVHYAAAFGVALATALCFYLLLTMSADARATRLEELLPDVLKLISANIRAGMTLENAVWSAARPEFGTVADEIKKVSADTYGGKPITQSLSKMSKRVRSETLDRAVKLVNEGILLGGEMARLLDEVAEDIRSVQLLKKEIATSTMMYSIFILFSSLLASPLLFSISVYYSEMNENILLKRAQAAGEGISKEAMAQAKVANLPGMAFGSEKKADENAIKASDVKQFAMAAIIVSTFSAALILGLIRTGKAIRGIKYAPLFVAVGLTIFLVMHAVISTAFKSILTT